MKIGDKTYQMMFIPGIEEIPPLIYIRDNSERGNPVETISFNKSELVELLLFCKAKLDQ